MDAKIQKSWDEFFANVDKQRDARAKLIRELPTDRRVKELLLALDALSDSHESASRYSLYRYPDGTVELSVPLAEIAARMMRSKGSAKSYIDLAVLTPYLKCSGSSHCSHTYLVCWMAIVDGHPGNETHAGGCRKASVGISGGGRRGSISNSGGGQNSPVEGVKTHSSGGQRLTPEGVKTDSGGGQKGGQNALLIPGIKYPVFNRESNSQIPGLKPGIGGGQKTGKLPIARLIPSWPPQIIGRDVNDEPIWRNGSVAWWRWWRGEIEKRSLRDPDDIEELFALGEASGLYVASAMNRLHVYSQALIDTRYAHRPGAIFRENVAFRRWYATCDIEDAAQAMIDQYDAEGVEPLPRPVRIDDTSEDDLLTVDAGENRDDQMAALQQWASTRQEAR